jgi:hypothetical protein
MLLIWIGPSYEDLENWNRSTAASKMYYELVHHFRRDRCVGLLSTAARLDVVINESAYCAKQEPEDGGGRHRNKSELVQ